MLNNYITLYSDKKKEDIITLKHMLNNLSQITIVWTDKDFNDVMSYIENQIEKNNLAQVIFFGLELGWDKLIVAIKKKYKNITIKVICNTSDALLYYDYERNNFFKLLELSRDGLVSNIGFLKRGMYECYTKLGYNTSYLKENIVLGDEYLNYKISNFNKSNDFNIGIYPLNYVWDKNIFNQLSVGKFIENGKVNYYSISERMDDFLNTMKINNEPAKLNELNEENLINEIIKNDVTVSCTFTDFFHPVALISLELGIPCILGNNSDLFEGNLKDYLVVDSEDNPIKVSEKIKNCIENKEEVMRLYKEWKVVYNNEAKNSITDFLSK